MSRALAPGGDRKLGLGGVVHSDPTSPAGPSPAGPGHALGTLGRPGRTAPPRRPPPAPDSRSEQRVCRY